MSFQRPTLSDLIDRIRADLAYRILGTSNVLRRSFIGILAIVWGGACHLIYGYLAFIAKMVIPDTAIDEFLTRWASIKNVVAEEAVFEAGTATFAAANGLVIPQGALMQTADGTQYSVDADATAAGGLGCIPSVTALLAGAAGARSPGDVMTLLSPISGVTSAGTWTTTTTEGADEESQESVRSRMLLKFQDPPQGGSIADYKIWAREVSGVTRAWVFANYGDLWKVGLTFVRDNDGTGSAIIPSDPEVQAVTDYINDPAEQRRPVTAVLVCFKPTAVPFNFHVALIPNTLANRTAVLNELTNLIFQEAVPGQTLLLSHIRAAIRDGVGSGDFILTSPNADIVYAKSEIGIMGTPTWA